MPRKKLITETAAKLAKTPTEALPPAETFVGYDVFLSDIKQRIRHARSARRSPSIVSLFSSIGALDATSSKSSTLKAGVPR